MSDLIGAGGKSGGGSATKTKDTLLSQDYFEAVLGISEGPIKGLAPGIRNSGENFFVGDTRLANPGRDEANFPDFILKHFHGYDTDPAIRFNLGGQASNIAVGVTLAQATPVIRQTASNLRGKFTRLEIRIQFARLVEVKDDGEFEADAKFQIAYKKSASPTWIFYEPETKIRGKTSSGAAKEFIIDLPSNPDDDWDIRLTKNSPDNSGDAGLFVDLNWESFQMVSLDPVKYADLAMVHIYGRASNQFSSVPDFAGIYDGLMVQVPTNYNPESRTYDESVPWNGTFKLAFTNNPAWILYALCTNQRWGLPRYYLAVSANRYEFYAAAKWCDEAVSIPGTSLKQPRFTFNEVFQDAKNGMEALAYIAGAFNSVVLDDGTGTITLRTDQPKTPKLIFTPQNVERGEFNYTFTDIATRYNDVTAVFINPDLDWSEDRRKATINNTKDVARNGLIPTEFVAIGCTNVHEAVRRANYHYITANTEKATVAFTTSRVGMFVEPFETIYVADPVSGWGKPGRIKSISNNKVYLRDPIFFPDVSPQELTLQTYNGIVKFTIAPAQVGANYFLNIVGGVVPQPSDYPDRTVFTLENTTNLGRAKPFKVLSIMEVEGSPDAYAITALEINVNKYPDADIGAQSESVKYSFTMPGEPVLPGFLNLESGLGQIQISSDGTLIHRIEASWQRPLDAFTSYYEIDYREISEPNWTTISPITGDSAFITPVKDNQRYNVRLFAVSPLGRRSVKFVERLNYLSSPKIQQLENVSGLTSYLMADGWKAFWKRGTFADYAGTEVRFGAANQPWEALQGFSTGDMEQVPLGFLVAGDYRLYAKYYDTSKNYSAIANYTQIKVVVPAAPILTDKTSGNQPEFSWEPTGTTQPIKWNYVRRGNTYATAVLIAKTKDNFFMHTETVAGVYRYWVDSEDEGGNLGPAASIQILVLPAITEAITTLRQDMQQAVGQILDINQGISKRILDEAANRGTAITAVREAYELKDTALAQDIVLGTARAPGYTRANLMTNSSGDLNLEGWGGDLSGFAAVFGPFGETIQRTGVLTAGVLLSPSFAVVPGEYYTLSFDTKFTNPTGALLVGYYTYNAAGTNIGQSGVTSFGNHDFSDDYERRRARAFEFLCPANIASVRFLLSWPALSSGAQVGVRMVKAERGRLPATSYTIEGTSSGGLAAFLDEKTARATDKTAEATARQVLAVRLDNNEVAVNTEATARILADNKILAKWGVSIDVNGKITGIALNNDGQSSSFVILADKFAFAQTSDVPGAYKYPFIAGTVAGISTIGISGLLVVDGTIKTRALEAESVTADKVKTRTLTANQVALGALTADVVNIGKSINLLDNSSFARRPGNQGQPSGWGTFTSIANRPTPSIVFGSNFSSTYNLQGGVSGYIEQVDADYNGFAFYDRNAQVFSSFVPATGGERYEASFYAATHRCQATIVLQFFDYQDNLLQSTGATPLEYPNGNGVILADYFRIGHFATAPANTAKARLIMIKGATLPGRANSYLFYCCPFLGVATANQTALSPYSSTGLVVKLSPEGIVTPSLAAFSADLGNVTAGTMTITGETNGGNGWGYLRSPDKWLDGAWGWILARHNNGNMFVDFTIGGMKFAMQNIANVPYAIMDWGGIVFDNSGSLTVRALNVIGTGNVIAGSMGQAYFGIVEAAKVLAPNEVGAFVGPVSVYNVSSGGGTLIVTINCLMAVNDPEPRFNQNDSGE